MVLIDDTMRSPPLTPPCFLDDGPCILTLQGQRHFSSPQNCESLAHEMLRILGCRVHGSRIKFLLQPDRWRFRIMVNLPDGLVEVPMHRYMVQEKEESRPCSSQTSSSDQCYSCTGRGTNDHFCRDANSSSLSKYQAFRVYGLGFRGR